VNSWQSAGKSVLVMIYLRLGMRLHYSVPVRTVMPPRRIVTKSEHVISVF
jgi:hypothetical protein